MDRFEVTALICVLAGIVALGMFGLYMTWPHP